MITEVVYTILYFLAKVFIITLKIQVIVKNQANKLHIYTTALLKYVEI